MLKDVHPHAQACGISPELFIRRLLVRVKLRGEQVEETIRKWTSSNSPEQSRELMLRPGLNCVHI